MAQSGSFHDLRQRFESCPVDTEQIDEPLERAAPPYLKDIAGRLWAVDGILRFAIIPPADEKAIGHHSPSDR